MPPLLPRMTLNPLFYISLSLISCCVSSMPINGRLLVPQYVSCERNELTSWAGSVTQLQRGEKLTSLIINTDDGTTESLALNHRDNNELMTHFYLNGLIMTTREWRNIADDKGTLRRATRATIWLCLDGKTPPIVNWQPPIP